MEFQREKRSHHRRTRVGNRVSSGIGETSRHEYYLDVRKNLAYLTQQHGIHRALTENE
jgi:hypothetical protein